jgi:ribosomal protein L11 methyltransferase
VRTSPALIVSFPDGTTAAERDRLVEFVGEFDLLAIHENDVTAPSAWTVHFGDTEARDAASAALAASPEFAGLRVEPVDVADDDWARRTQADLPAIQIGRIVVAPPWDIPPTGGGGSSPIVIVIEPSRGFGTGHHQSTRLCLVLLQEREMTRRSAIDVGTGSGVLAIAAARLGATTVEAIDVDPDAVENARENVERNGVGRSVSVHVRDLSDATLVPADVVTANLTAALLERHAPQLKTLVRRGGTLIVSGFTVDERERVTAAFEPEMALAGAAEEDGWWALAFVDGR